MKNKDFGFYAEVIFNTAKIQRAMDMEDWDLTRQLKELKELIFLKALSREAAIPLKKLRDKTITADEWLELSTAVEKIKHGSDEVD